MKLFVSDIYKSNNPDVLLVLAAFVRKTLCAQQVVERVYSSDRRFVCFSNTSARWSEVNPRTKFPKIIVNSIKAIPINSSLYLVRHLGSGADGVVWLARTLRGQARVVKLFRETVDMKPKKAMKTEMTMWSQAYKDTEIIKFVTERVLSSSSTATSKTERISPTPALVMPIFLTPSTMAMRVEYRAAVEEAINTIAHNGVLHEDVHWRHVGLYEDESAKTLAVLFDLGRASLSELPVEALIQKMIEQLAMCESMSQCRCCYVSNSSLAQ